MYAFWSDIHTRTIPNTYTRFDGFDGLYFLVMLEVSLRLESIKNADRKL